MINTQRIDHLYKGSVAEGEKLFLHYGDLTDSTNIVRLIKKIKPDEIYNLGAMSHVKVSFDLPEYVADTDGIGTLRILEAIRLLGMERKVKIYQASTQNFMVKFSRFHKTKIRHSIQGHLMVLRNFMLFG